MEMPFCHAQSLAHRTLVKFKILQNLHRILSHVVSVKFTVEILENFMSFSEYMNFKNVCKSAELETVYVFTVY